MRILCSIGILLALGSVLAKKAVYDEGISGVDNASLSAKSNASNSSSSTTFTEVHHEEFQAGTLGRNQHFIVENWGKLKNSDTYARQFKLRTAWRITLYLPISEPVKMSEFGPNTRAEVIRQLFEIIANLQPDSKNSVYSVLPPEYSRLSRSSSSSSTTTTTTTSSPLSQEEGSDRSLSRSTAVEETIEDDEE